MDILEKLEWNKITNEVQSCALSQLGKTLSLEMPFFNDINKIEYELNLTDEAVKLTNSMLIPPLNSMLNIEEIFYQAKLNRILSEDEILETIKCLKMSRLIKGFFTRNADVAEELSKISKDLFEDKEFEEKISELFNENGQLKNDASPELKSLNNAFKDNSANLKNTVSKTLQTLEKYLQEPIYTMRDGRYVFPVNVAHKAHVQGIVHDVSASGSTLFIEPKNIVELNNKVVELELQIEREIKRILSEVTEEILLREKDILNSHKIIGRLDFIFAKAKYALQIKASKPDINNEHKINIKSFKHPILLKFLENVVENDIELGDKYDCLVITGSNTGGKTVTLKSVALCVLMAKAGLFIPAKSGNIYPFKNIFADIGDEQSIVQSLSTFSGHLKNIIDILNKSDNDTLVLLDEVGAGTDPQEGSALAQAILEYLNNIGAKTIVTTHYGELKALAYTFERFENASVQFDTDKLKPTYKLLIGIPGKSNAITIATNLGLNETIANKANEIYHTQKDNTGKVLEGLQNAQRELDKNVEIAQEKRLEVEKLENDYTEKLEKVREQRKKTVDIYKKKYESKIILAKTEIKQILDEIRQTKSEKLARRAFARLSKMENDANQEFEHDMEEIAPIFKKVDWNSAKIGDSVFLKKLNQVVEIKTLPDKSGNMLVVFNNIEIKVKAKDVYFTDKKAVKKLNIDIKKGFEFKKYRTPSEIDIRGMRVLDALDKLDKYLDEASLSNLPQVTIIHGAGTGALRQAVREYLKDSAYAKTFRMGKDFEGSDGVTIIELC
ncbi:MAG: endonuclease MutS2 [Candidatus Gastranaerophilales bacterium]|nr:endonuclease MutS2 [Candidatus Gastranaerophilales bacterium]